MEEKVVVEVYNGKTKLKTNEFWSYDKACKYAKEQVNICGFTVKIKRLINGNAWAVSTLYPNETM